MEYLSYINKPVWLCYVLAPQYTDDEKDLTDWTRYAAQFKNVERVDMLPFHQMAIHKWEEINTEYKLKDINTPNNIEIVRAESIFKSFGLPV